MKIVFVVVGVENLAVEYLSSFLKKSGHQTDIVFDSQIFSKGVFRSNMVSEFFDVKSEIAREVLLLKPDLIGFSVFSINYQRSLALAKEIKKISSCIPIIFGGIHPTSVPDVVIKEKCVDFVCVGEGEHALLELLNSYKNNIENLNIKNIWFKRNNKIIKNVIRPLVENLDLFPFPDKLLFYKTQPKYIRNDYVCLSSRGCPFACSYCGNSIYQNVYQGLGKHNRRRSPENVIEELVIAKKMYHPKVVHFIDDVFAQDENWLKKFASLYKKKINLPYHALTHARFLNLSMAKLLKKSGCFLVEFGVQTASELTRTKILNRYETNEEIRKAADVCHKIGINLAIDHIFYLPGEGVEHQIESLKFYNELRPKNIFYFDLQYYPRTGITKTALDMKIISSKAIEKIDKGIIPFFDPDPTNVNIEILFDLIPYLPRPIIDRIIEKKLYIPSIQLSKNIYILIRIIINLIKHIGFTYIDVVRNMLFFGVRNLKFKFKNRSET